MSCTNPLIAVNLGVDPDSGKMRIKILPKKNDHPFSYWSFVYGSENILQLPCGRCDSCIEKRTRSWAARCVLEASLYQKNCFVTLTYRDSCLPKGGLCKKDLQDFIKRLRRKTGQKLRYFSAGEYGTLTKRPHYHLIIFNYFPSDGVFFKRSNFGGFYYTSKELSDTWKFGHVLIGDVSYASCAYVARYCQKKLSGVHDKKEFSLMSLKPGIGYRYLEQHLMDIYETDKIYFQFGRCGFVQPFRYFDKVLENIDPERLEFLKTERISISKTSIASDMLRLGLDEVEKLYKYKAALKKLDFDKLKRRN